MRNVSLSLRIFCNIYDVTIFIELNMYKVAVIILLRCKMCVMKIILLYVVNEHSHDFNCVVVLQNGMKLMEDGPASGSEAIETTLDEGTEDGNMKVEFDIKVDETLDIKEENSEGITSPTIKAVPEVSV